ncbi:MAG: hypothetical protein M1335_01360 [Chloroflexi bacterium]|nr:hypothetical protein [Chloroflexota bacterium]
MSSRAKQYAAVAIAAVAVGSFAFTPVRTYAGNVLSVFRVSKINTLNITLDDMRQIRRGMERGGRINMESFGSISATGNRQITRVTLEEARRAVDFSIKLPQGLGDPTLNLQAASSINMNLKVNNINTFLKSMGGTKMLPSSLDGRQFTFSMPAAVTGEYGSEGSSVYVAESRSPELRAPEGTDVNSIRDALLDIPVLPDNIKTQLEAVNDWQHTILIPNVEGGSQKVIVNGQEGVFVGTPGGMGVGGGDRRRGSVNKDMKALVWQYGGVVYAVGGRLTLDKALAIAGSMK